jgi:ribosomal protein S18 acetylase RimI-like enzyme
MSGAVIRPAVPEDADAVGDVLADAFVDYPWTAWALGETDRRARLAALYRLEAGLVGAEAGTTWLAEDDGLVVAAATWVRPDAEPPSPSTAELLARDVPALLGARAEVLAAAEAATSGLQPSGLAWFLACVGTRPAWRGRGLAAALVRAGLIEVDRRALPAALETSSEENVRLYRRLGFDVVAEVDPPHGAPHVWVMHRSAQVSGRRPRSGTPA